MINRLKRLGAAALKQPQAQLDSQWYSLAGAWCDGLDSDFSLAPGTGAGVVAALSPLQSWQSQLKFVPPSIAAWLQYPSSAVIRGPGFLSNKDKAARILAGESPLDVLSDDKVTRFFRNLTGDYSCVTIDSHGWDMTRMKPTARNYKRVEFAFRMAAEFHGLTPAEFQAVVWNFWRRTRASHKAHNRKGEN